MQHTKNDIAKMAAALGSYVYLMDNVEIWKEQSSAFKKLKEIAGPLLNEEALLAQNDRDRNVRLRFEVSRLWNEAVASGNGNLALELSFWIVKGWGGIKNIKDETIKSHHFAAVNKLFGLPFEHISSSSKVITLTDPEIYQIYDARVAVSLNVIQLAANTEVRIYFEIPDTQITWISGHEDCFRARIPKQAFLDDFGFKAIPKEEIYRYYTMFLSKIGVDAVPQLDPIEVEMALFALAFPFSKNTDSVLTKILGAERDRLRTLNI